MSLQLNSTYRVHDSLSMHGIVFFILFNFYAINSKYNCQIANNLTGFRDRHRQISIVQYHRFVHQHGCSILQQQQGCEANAPHYSLYMARNHLES